jgi:hypothetical protein
MRCATSLAAFSAFVPLKLPDSSISPRHRVPFAGDREVPTSPSTTDLTFINKIQQPARVSRRIRCAVTGTECLRN